MSPQWKPGETRGRKPGDGNPGTDGTFSASLFCMARMARIVAVNVPHHVTQRGNARQFLLVTDDERAVYLGLLQKYSKLHQLRLLGYCLMSNHVHLVVMAGGPH
jgi:hypothetical protein